MRIWLVEILVRLGVAVIADGRCRPRWYGSDQVKLCEYSRAAMRSSPFGLIDWFTYYSVRTHVTGANWQSKQYRAGILNARRGAKC